MCPRSPGLPDSYIFEPAASRSCQLLPGCYTWAGFPVYLRCCRRLFSRALVRLAPVTGAADAHVPPWLALETQAANSPVSARDSRLLDSAQHPPGVSRFASRQSPPLSLPRQCWVGSCLDSPCPGVVGPCRLGLPPQQLSSD